MSDKDKPSSVKTVLMVEDDQDIGSFILRAILYLHDQHETKCISFTGWKQHKMMKEPFEGVEQNRDNEAEIVRDRIYYQLLRGHYQTLMDHHQSLMEHHQFLLNHHQTVHALYRAVLDSQLRRRGPQLQLDWQTYRRAVRNHRQLVGNHLQMLEEYYQIKQKRPHRQDL